MLLRTWLGLISYMAFDAAGAVNGRDGGSQRNYLSQESYCTLEERALQAVDGDWGTAVLLQGEQLPTLVSDWRRRCCNDKWTHAAGTGALAGRRKKQSEERGGQPQTSPGLFF
ncbi:hypothetical protein CC78DRAFT_573324 [Lojkania enalia]|uniref:Uncharacterized protein n=1 Tax=Lojkania enalia TaxID=147567 RepID=A0A9P4NCZ4_9PLEO|nr:hypothetical protein CC78DRAFT_573324 [Didymosphaeria enalia]